MFSLSRRWLAVQIAITVWQGGSDSHLFGYALEGQTWPFGTTVKIELGLGAPKSGILQDGFLTFNASAANALALWNQQLSLMQFSWSVVAPPGGHDDGQNQAFFASTVYGQTFGSGVLAITLIRYNGTTMLEGDTVFNSFLLWDSYRGPLQYDFRTKQYVFDFHRVALHEFGHTLGLDHPDDYGQVVSAIMNSHISDLDHLADDDLTGIRTLYGRLTTSASTGSDFSFQLVMANNPTSFSAGQLPAGLTLDATTGLISGVPTLSGVYDIPVTAFGSQRNFTFTLRISITPPPFSGGSGQLLKMFDYLVNRLAIDSRRPRIYASLATLNSVLVLDTDNLSVVSIIPVGNNPLGMALSADNSHLWVANSGSSNAGVTGIDLSTLQVAFTVPTPYAGYYLAEGINGRLFASSLYGIMEIDAATGTYQKTWEYVGTLLATSLDRKTLYGGDTGSSPSTLVKFDVSAPDLSVLLASHTVGANGEDLKMSHDGTFLLYPNGGGNVDAGYTTTKISPVDLTNRPGGFSTGAYPGPIALSNDDSVAYQDVEHSHKIEVFETNTFNLLTSFSLDASPGHGFPDLSNDLIVDQTGAHLFVATYNYSLGGDLRVYTTGRVDRPLPSPKSLTNVSTRMYVGTGDNVEIGGFIIKGTQPKKVVIRAIAPSLSRYGVAGPMADPVLELHDGTGAIVTTNDNWNSYRQAVLSSGLAPADEHESVIITTLSPGNYTTVLRGLRNTTGVALFELYDIDPTNSKVANISTRGNVGTGDNVMIGGFIVGGAQPTNMLVRALGPTLTDFGVTGALADPILELHDDNGAIIAQNDNWKSTQRSAIQNSGYAPPKDAEAAILATLQPGNYTAIVRGSNNTTGVALVEVYNLDAN